MPLIKMSDINPMTLERLYKEYADRVYVNPIYKVESIELIRNGCCNDLPVLITTNIRPDGKTNYSAQCACGSWVTTGKDSAAEALKEYERMSRGEILYE